MSINPGSNSVLCAGRLYCDLVFTGVANMPVIGTETFSDDLSLHAGGGAFITAAAFSVLGWKTSLLATLPVAPFDGIVLKDTSDFDVDTSLCSQSSTGASPQITVAIAGDADRAFLSHKTGTALPDTEFVRGDFKHLHIGELRSLVEHQNLIAKARKAGMTISVDCSWDPELLNQGAQLAELLSQVDVFLPNEAEYDHLTASGLTQAAPPLTVIKCGQEGAKALDQGRWISMPTTPSKVVDTTGAGDSFNGGFLSSWLQGHPLGDCLENGNLCGRFSIERAGGTGGLLILRNALAAKQLDVAQ